MIFFSPLHQGFLELRTDQLYEEFQAHKFNTQKKYCSGFLTVIIINAREIEAKEIKCFP